MSKAEDTYISATAEYVKAKTKKAKNPKAYNAAKDKLHAARIAWREERDQAQTAGQANRIVEKR